MRRSGGSSQDLNPWFYGGLHDPKAKRSMANVHFLRIVQQSYLFLTKKRYAI